VCSSHVNVWLVIDDFLPALSVMFNLAYAFCCVALSFIFIVEVHFIYIYVSHKLQCFVVTGFLHICMSCFYSRRSERGYAALVSYISHWKSVGTFYVCLTVRVSIIVVSIKFWKF
jgi:hypothetical protein